MLLPVFAIAQPPTATVVFPNQWNTQGIGMFGDEQDMSFRQALTEFSGTVAPTGGPLAMLGDEQAVAIPYASLWMADIITHGTSIPPMWTVTECEDPEQEWGEADMFLVRQFLWATSPQPARKISQVTRDSVGAILGQVVVKLFRTDEDLVLEQEISDPTTGAVTLSVFDPACYYYTSVKEVSASSTTLLASSGAVRASDASQVTGLSANTLQGT